MLIIVSGLACINGLVMYAVYANCDPLTAGEIRRNDQVLTNKFNQGQTSNRMLFLGPPVPYWCCKGPSSPPPSTYLNIFGYATVQAHSIEERQAFIFSRGGTQFYYNYHNSYLLGVKPYLQKHRGTIRTMYHSIVIELTNGDHTNK